MLLTNYNVFNSSPGRAIGGPTNPTLSLKVGTMYNFYLGDHIVSGQTDKSSFPDGYRPPYTWLLAPKSGALSSHRQTTITASQTASLAGGLPASGSTTITFSQTATGSLIKLASGTATITISGTSSIAALGLLSGQATATITATATGVLLTIALISGQATIAISSSAAIGALAGVNGSAAITLTPTATIKAIGYLAGLSTSETEFSAAALANAVWTALAADFQTAGSMGEKMNSAGSAGDPWTTILPGSYTAGTAGEMLTLIKRLLANDLTKAGDTVTIKSDDGLSTFKEFTSTATERTEI